MLDRGDELAVQIYNVNEKHVYDRRIKALSSEIHRVVEEYKTEEEEEGRWRLKGFLKN